jgi:rhamnosyltransferase
MVQPETVIEFSKHPLVSVIIPVKNGAVTLASCLKTILSQSVEGGLEVIVIDSGSTDGSVEIMSKFPVRIHLIPAQEFNHGETRNLGVRLAKGEFVVMTVQDAVPVNSRWIQRMLQHFSDAQVAGVCGQQIVEHVPDKNPLQWFHSYSQPVPKKILFSNSVDFMRLPPSEQLALCGWDDVTAMYRRSALLEQPFQSVSFSEDQLWAKDALARSWALVYEPRARVYHYHNEGFGFRFRRTFTTQYFTYRAFSYQRLGQSPLRSFVVAAYHLIRNKKVSWRGKFKWLVYNLSLDSAEWLANGWFVVVLWMRGAEALNRAHQHLCGQPPQPANYE